MGEWVNLNIGNNSATKIVINYVHESFTLKNLIKYTSKKVKMASVISLMGLSSWESISKQALA